jgi:hypothetical protein
MFGNSNLDNPLAEYDLNVRKLARFYTRIQYSKFLIEIPYLWKPFGLNFDHLFKKMSSFTEFWPEIFFAKTSLQHRMDP